MSLHFVTIKGDGPEPAPFGTSAPVDARVSDGGGGDTSRTPAPLTAGAEMVTAGPTVAPTAAPTATPTAAPSTAEDGSGQESPNGALRVVGGGSWAAVTAAAAAAGAVSILASLPL